MNPPILTFDHILHLIELLPVLYAALKVVRAVNRIEGILKDFPPHRHAKNGDIFYPKGFEPTEVQHLSAK